MAVGIGTEEWRTSHPEQSWSEQEWREWDKKHGHILWMGSIQVRKRLQRRGSRYPAELPNVRFLYQLPDLCLRFLSTSSIFSWQHQLLVDSGGIFLI